MTDIHAAMGSVTLDAGAAHSSKRGELDQLRDDYASLQAAHHALLERVERNAFQGHDNSDDMLQLRTRIKQLETDLSAITSERDELSSTVRDLRVRVEESRRAIMRLQGGGSGTPMGAGLTPSASASGSASGGLGIEMSAASSSNGMSTHNKIDARRSMGPGLLASWNPRELGGASSSGQHAAENEAGSPSLQSIDDVADIKKAKRASIAFGPYAHGGTMGRRVGHRSMVNGDGDSAAMQPPAVSVPDGAGANSSEPGPGGLRELRLGGMPAHSAAAPTASGTSSKRSSFIGSSFLRSPQPEAGDATPDNPLDRSPSQQQLQPHSGSLLMPSRSIRRSSNSSQGSGGGQPTKAAAREEAENLLTMPRTSSRMRGMSASPSNNALPLPAIDSRPVAPSEGHSPAGSPNARQSARARAASAVFGPQQQQNLQTQRTLNEVRERLSDREMQLHALRKEMLAVRQELDGAKEARRASEACLKALRDFVRTENGDDDLSLHEDEVLRGVKLPPLPSATEEEVDEDEESFQASNASSVGGRSRSSSTVPPPPSAWRSLGKGFANFSKRASIGGPSAGPPPPGAVNFADMKQPGSEASTGPLTSVSMAETPSDAGSAGPLGSTLGVLWSRATSTRGSVSASSRASFETADGVDAPGGTTTQTVASPELVTSSPRMGNKGYGWFGKRSMSSTSASGSNADTSHDGAGQQGEASAAERVTSPPFVNLDNHVLTVDPHSASKAVADTSLLATPRKASMPLSATNDASPSSAGAGLSSRDDLGPSARARKAREKSEVVDEDSGFVPPAFA